MTRKLDRSLRREAWRENQRLLADLKEMEDATFAPRLNTHKAAFARVGPRINLAQPELYLAELEYKRQVEDEVRRHVQREREVRPFWRSSLRAAAAATARHVPRGQARGLRTPPPADPRRSPATALCSTAL